MVDEDDDYYDSIKVYLNFLRDKYEFKILKKRNY